MPEQADTIEWAGDNFQAVRDFCRRESDGFSAVVYRDGGALFLDAVGGTARVHPGDRIMRLGPDTFEVVRAP